MHLKSLTLKGFKSFAQPTTLVFEPGVTCVVGPNGSGKSNVVDALAWVMGEQGAKSLRGGKMEDVIFAGTATRGPLGRAEVTLTIDNHDGVLPIEYSEVTIRRTLFRNGGSEYAINGEGVRLLDVQELLSDTGLGREMHVIVGQGRLDSVLHATPEERRGFIEEAAGILKHRRRKERTVRKLEGMEQNLTRLRDLTGEVRRQLKPLGRQAEAARRAHGIAAIARDARARIMADDVARLRATLREATASEQERRAEREVLQERLARAVATAERIVAAQRGDAVDGARRVVFDLESVAERLRNLELLASQRRALLRQRLDAPDFTPSVTAREVEDVRHEASLLDERASAAAAEWTAAGGSTRDARAALDEVDDRIRQASDRASRYAVREQELKGAADTAASRLAAVRGDVLRQTNARDAASARAADADEALARIEADTSQGETDSTGLDEAHERARQEVAAGEAALETLRDRLHDLERERDALDARATALALATRIPDAAGALLDADLPGVRGTVTEHVRVAPGGEGAVATALGQLADAVLVAGLDAAVDVVDHARDGDLGRVELVVDEPDDGDAPLVDDAVRRALEEPGTSRARDLLDAAPRPVRRLLSNVVVVDDLALAVRVHERTRSLAGELVLVTRGGEVLGRSTMRGGSAGTGRSRLELTAERERASARLAEVRDEVDRLAIDVAEQRGALEQARSGAAAALERLRAFDADLAQRREALNRAQARRDAARAELARAVKALELAGSGVADAEARAEGARSALDAHRAEPKPVVDGAARDEYAARVERAREAEVEARLRVETLRERARAESGRARQLAERLDAERAAAERAARETVLRRRELVRTEDVLAALPLAIAAVSSSVEEARDRLRAAQAEREAQDAELVLVRREESELRARAAALADDVHALELRIAERGLELRGLLERVASELGLTEAVLVAEYGPHRRVPGDDDALRDLAERAAEAAAAAAAARAADDEATGEVATGEDAAGRDPVDRDEVGDVEAGAGTAVGGTTSVRERLAAADAEPGLGDLHASDEERAAAGEGTVGGPTPPTEPVEPVEPEDGVPFVRAAQEKRLAGAERQLSQLGRVNPLALEEFAALEQRHGFLVAQLDDLERTRTDLLEIVGEIDERMRTVFEAAFEDTRRAFHEVFPVLFPGGEGDITLTLPDDMLRTGIEVTVKPAGKKIERLTLLSGGERSLAAVALLIAIFKARPSPFYIMDEVEAALDDANLGRLLQVFQDLRASSQLIVITHQKRTMEIADALYGVSMRRDGVSAVVGQRIEHAERAEPREDDRVGLGA